MLRIAVLAAGLALLPAAAMAQGQVNGLHDPQFRHYALTQHPSTFSYSFPVSFGAILPQRRLVPSEPLEEGVSGHGFGAVSGIASGPPRTRRIIHIIE